MRPEDTRISGIILAAGRSERIDRIKQILPFRGTTILGKVVENALGSCLHEVIVVLGHAAEEIKQAVDFAGAEVVVNKNYLLGQSASLRVGLSAVSGDSAAVLFILGDQPLVSAGVIDALAEKYRQQKAPFVIPTYRGKRGNPVLIDRAVFPRLESLEGDVGARVLFDEYIHDLREIEMGDEHIAFDVDTLDDYARLKEMDTDTTD